MRVVNGGSLSTEMFYFLCISDCVFPDSKIYSLLLFWYRLFWYYWLRLFLKITFLFVPVSLKRKTSYNRQKVSCMWRLSYEGDSGCILISCCQRFISDLFHKEAHTFIWKQSFHAVTLRRGEDRMKALFGNKVSFCIASLNAFQSINFSHMNENRFSFEQLQ